MDAEIINRALQEVLTSVAIQAREDAERGESNIGSIFEDTEETLPDFDMTKIEEAIININKATSSKEGVRRLVYGLMLAAKIAARVYPA